MEALERIDCMKRRLFFLIFSIGFALMSFAQGQDAGEEIKVLSDGTKYIVHPSKIRSGGPPPDGIPSIDNPVFESVGEADEWLSDDDWVVVLKRSDVIRMYPLDILVWHEIVNDTVAGEGILITYCPLCGSAIAFNREIDGKAVEFGTSGKLYNSNLIMYDRLTDTYWTQIGGKAIVGELTGWELQPVSIHTVSWGAWKELHPDAEVLSRATGHTRQYGRDPYGDYYTDPGLMFPVEREDNRLHAKEVIYGIELNGEYKAYPRSAVVGSGRIEDELGGVTIVILHEGSGAVTFTRGDTGEVIVKERDFWFAWAAFHPETELYRSAE
jgi:hypothetical protein